MPLDEKGRLNEGNMVKWF
jgi:hypothetical protein